MKISPSNRSAANDTRFALPNTIEAPRQCQAKADQRTLRTHLLSWELLGCKKGLVAAAELLQTGEQRCICIGHDPRMLLDLVEGQALLGILDQQLRGRRVCLLAKQTLLGMRSDAADARCISTPQPDQNLWR